MDGLDWIGLDPLRSLVPLEHLAVLIMSLLMVVAMTNYEIVDGTGLTHCAPMVGHMTPFKVTCMLISTHTILQCTMGKLKKIDKSGQL